RRQVARAAPQHEEGHDAEPALGPEGPELAVQDEQERRVHEQVDVEPVGTEPSDHADERLRRNALPPPRRRKCKEGASSPLPEPPSSSGTPGAPAAHPFGPGRDAWSPGKTDPPARAKPIPTRGVSLALPPPRRGEGTASARPGSGC